jgi:colanic acid biosynthesis glycosyl transferase WcaI
MSHIAPEQEETNNNLPKRVKRIRSMHILVVVPHYRPDGGPSAPQFTMLCEELVLRGHQVTVLTAVPHYPSGQVPKEYRGKLREKTIENGVNVIRVALPSVKRNSLFWRMLQFIAYQIGSTLAGWKYKCDVLLTVTAAIQVWLPFTFLSVMRHRPVVYSVHDVYPDTGVKSGVFRNKAVIQMVSFLENFCLKNAARVRILSESFKPGLLTRGVLEAKLGLIYDWIDTGLIKPLPANNNFAVKHELVDDFIVLYAGNIGILQGLESVLEAANMLRDSGDIRFVFVGDGTVKETLIEKAHQLNLSNVIFLPYQPFAKMPEILATSDVSLVSLIKGSGFGALPSKSYSIMASGRPILASVDEGCETWTLVERAEAGICVPPENPEALAKAILTLKGDPALRERMGQNGRAWAEKYHSPQSAAIQFEKLLLEAISTTNNRGQQ